MRARAAKLCVLLSYPFAAVPLSSGDNRDSYAMPHRPEKQNSKQHGAASEEILQLPPVDPNSNTKLPSIKLGETISFEEMGPIILNTDGTTRRISNWESLTEQEQKATWRRISKRNEERRQQLMKEQEDGTQLNIPPADESEL